MFDRETLQRTASYQQALLDEAKWRQSIASQYAQMMERAFFALRSYGVDYTRLKSYKLWPTFQPPEGPVTMQARSKMAHWIGLISRDLDAAILRTRTIKVVDNKEDPYA